MGLMRRKVRRRPVCSRVQVEHGGGEEPEVDEMAEDALHVAEMHGQGGDEEAEAEGEDELHEDGQGQEERRGLELPVREEEAEEDGEPQEELHEVGEDRDHRQDLGREQDLLDQVPPAMSTPEDSRREALSQLQGRMPQNRKRA